MENEDELLNKIGARFAAAFEAEGIELSDVDPNSIVVIEDPYDPELFHVEYELVVDRLKKDE